MTFRSGIGVANGERVRHIVMWKVSGGSEPEKAASIATVKSCFEGLRGLIPGMTSLEIGVDFSKVSYACDVVLCTEFNDRAALDAYSSHPAHLRVRDELEGLRIARHQVDYLMQNHDAP